MMGQSTKFWDKMAERYSKKPIADEAAYQKKLQVTRECPFLGLTCPRS